MVFALPYLVAVPGASVSHAQPGLTLPSSVLRMAFGGLGTPPSGLVRKKHAAWPISQKGCPCLYVDATSIAPRQVQCSKPAQEDWDQDL